jgi:hypothetical protein
MIVPDLATLALVAGSLLVLCLFGLTASSMFPAEHRPRGLSGVPGAGLIYLTIGAALALAVQTVRLAANGLAWEIAVVAAGLVLLFAPALHQILPQALRTGATGHCVFAAGTLAMHVVVWSALDPAPA